MKKTENEKNVVRTSEQEQPLPFTEESMNQVSIAEMEKEEKTNKARFKKLDNLVLKSNEQMQKSTLNVAFAIYEIKQFGLFKYCDEPYKDVYAYAMDRFGIKKTTINNFINLVDRFGKHIAEGQPVTEISEQYNEFGTYKLIAMLGHTDEELQLITPDMSVRQIKQTLKEQDNNIVDGSIVEGSETVTSLEDNEQEIEEQDEQFELPLYMVGNAYKDSTLDDEHLSMEILEYFKRENNISQFITYLRQGYNIHFVCEKSKKH